MKATKQNQRLLSSSQFRTVYERGQKFNTPYFSAFVLRTNSECQRLGITTTRKIGNAVLRNRCRRRLREIFRLRDQAKPVKIGYDIVLNVKPNTATADYKEVEKAFLQTLYHFEQAWEDAKDSEEAR